MSTSRFLRRLGGVAVLGGVLAMTACSSVDRLLEVENPERILEDELQDERLVNILVNSVIGDFQDAYDDPFIWRGSMFTDEQITGINWEQTARLSQRIVRFDEGDADLMFSDISEARALADSVVGRFRGSGGEALLDAPESDERLARVLAYAGYSYILMAEAMCEATVNVGAEIYQPAQLFGFAAERFEDAINVARAAGADDVVSLAHVGAARANLGAGNASAVMSHAGQVPEDFVWWANYSDNSGGENNVMYSRTHGGNHALGMHPHFLQGTFGEDVPAEMQTDPRVQHTTEWSLGHNRLTQLYKPYQSLPYSEYTGETQAEGGSVGLAERYTDIKIASWLEAMHHYYEAAGPGGSGPLGTTLEFVNARRAYGNQDAVDLSGDALMAELREQRGKDMFLGGFRLGDLRRWQAQGIDLFPSGPHPVPQWGLYGDATCYPLPVEEYEGNPNINKPG